MRLFTLPPAWVQFVRYYQAGIVNTAFGFGSFAALVWLGANAFAAQAIAHLAGVAFNYFTYSRHAFEGSAPARTRFAAAYAFNYALSLGALALASTAIASPYLAGLIAVVIVSLINFFVLKHLVFLGRAAG